MTSNRPPLEAKEENIKLQGMCSKCNRPVRSLRKGSFTSWLFRPASCMCDSTLPPKAISKSTATSESKELAQQAERIQDIAPRLPERFEILEVLGRGGMGAVYKVRDRELDITLALKVLRPELASDQEAIRRFEHEAKMAKELTHPNIGAVYGYDSDESGTPFLTMEFIEGSNLHTLLKESGALEDSKALTLFIEIAEALEYAHSKGVIHRDIKPSNVLFMRDDTGGRVARLIDFGIARIMPSASGNRETQDLSRTGDVFGTPTYMSPEQCMGLKLDQRSDIYSLGCLMYETLTGAPPYVADNPIQLVVKQMNERAASWSGVPDGKAYSGIEGVVMRCLEKDNRERYQSVSDLLVDLRLCASGSQPPPFKRTREVSPLHSSGEVARLMIEFLSITVYALSVFFMSAWWMVLCFIPLAPLSIYRLIRQFAKDKLGSEGKIQWQILAQAFFTLACFAALAMVASLYGAFERFSLETQQSVVSCFYLHWLALSFTVAAQAGNLFFNSKERLKLGSILRPLAGASLVVVLLTASFVTPSAISRFLDAGPVALPNLKAGIAKLEVLTNHSDASAYVALAQYAERRGDVESMNKNLAAALSAQPDSTRTLAQLAEIYARAGQQKTALELLQKAIAIDPSAYYCYKQSGDIYSGQGKFQEALRQYDKAIAAFPEFGPAYSNRAAVNVRLGRDSDAINDLSRVISIRNIRDEQQLLRRAVLFEKAGELDKARSDYAEVVKRTSAALSTNDQPGAKMSEFLRLQALKLSPLEGGTETPQLRRAFANCKLGNDAEFRRDLDYAKQHGGSEADLLKEFKSISGLRVDWQPLRTEAKPDDV